MASRLVLMPFKLQLVAAAQLGKLSVRSSTVLLLLPSLRSTTFCGGDRQRRARGVDRFVSRGDGRRIEQHKQGR